MRVAGTLTNKDWKDLEYILKPKENENWGNAFHFFEERIRTRYLEPIQAILDMEKYEGEGFAVVNLQCSLIETIESFINGWVHNSAKNKWYDKKIENDYAQMDGKRLKKNSSIFISFFSKRSPFKEQRICGEEFFKYVRCALLHQTQTKNNWFIRKNSSKISSYECKNGEKIIYRDQFQRDLEVIIKNYKKAIIEEAEFDEKISTKDLRANFCAKFNHLCKQ